MPFRTSRGHLATRQIEYTTVNGVECDTGCWGEGHRGQYLPDRVAEIYEELGLELKPEDDPRYWRKVADAEVEAGIGEWAGADAWQSHSETCDRLVDLLNEVTEGDYQWGFHDGEFFLWPNTTWQEEEW